MSARERTSSDPESTWRAADARRIRGRPLQPIRARAVLLALALIPIAVFYMVQSDWLVGGGASLDSLISTAVAALAVLAAANNGMKRWRPRWAFTSGEVICVYVVLVIAIGITGGVYDWNSSVATVITWPIWNASPENQWYSLIWPNLPTWLTIPDREPLTGFFMGETNPYQAWILRAWLRPAVWWTAWATALLWVSLCLNVIVRKRWSQEEQLPFPMTILPLQITDQRSGLLSNPVWWAGVTVSGSIYVINAISRFVPAFPGIPTSVDIGNYLANNKPWDVLRTPTLGWDPWSIGLSYLMPVDLAFSMIVFNVFWRAEYVATRLLGWTTSGYGGFPYGDQQTIGGYLALMISVIWLDRKYLVQVVRKAAGLRSVADDSEEAFSYRLAVFGALGGLAFLWYFLGRAGMSHPVVGAFLFLYFIMAMAMSRIRAHLGPPNHEMYGTMPEFALTEFPGTRALGPRGMAILALLRPYMGEQRPNPSPVQLEALRMAERDAINPTPLAWIIMAAVPLTMLCYFWANIHVGYHLGMGTAKVSRSLIFVARESSQKLDEWLRAPGDARWGGVEAIGVGFGGTLALMALKLQFSWWPLHPIAFPLAFCYPIDAMTPAIVISWLIKTLLLRYGGLRSHRRALPFFLGLIVGSATAGTLQSIVLRALGVNS